MYSAVLTLLHPAKFAVVCKNNNGESFTTDAHVHNLQYLLNEAEKEYEQNTGHVAANITLDAKAKNPQYDIPTGTIVMQFHEKFSAVRYIWDWAHEHAHHEQSNQYNSNINFTMAQISREFYPTPPLNWLRQPKPAYIGNYNEIIARTASLSTLTKACWELTTQDDFTITHREQILPELRECQAQALEYQKRFSLSAMTEFNKTQLAHYKPEDALYIDMPAADVCTFFTATRK